MKAPQSGDFIWPSVSGYSEKNGSFGLASVVEGLRDRLPEFVIKMIMLPHSFF